MTATGTQGRERINGEMSAAEFIEVVGRQRRQTLKLILIAGDASALFLGMVISLVAGGFVHEQSYLRTVAAIALFVGAGLWAMRSQGLLQSRISAVRVVEITRITRALAILGVAMLVFDRVAHYGLYVRQILAATTASWLLLVISRSIYRSWLSARRQRDLHCRRVVAIGVTEETRRLTELFATHPDLGIRIVGVVGDLFEAKSHVPTTPWLGDLDDAELFVDDAEASGVIVSSDGMASSRLNSLVRNLLQRGVHVHIATGIAGIDARRMRSQPLAHEPFIYIEPLTMSRSQHVLKRAFDLVVATVAVIITSPLMLLVALLIKLEDHGPVFFHQQRVGFGGSTFGLIKFRTMAVDAEARLANLQGANERNGPLFKMVDDPRVTRIGRFLRQSSLDELPQLLNVLSGRMSLVGPRPALPCEVAAFSSELRAREQVMPGITGLWQVEARDNPSFEAYRRLDLFYVENWSITLDLLIILGTVEQFASRLVTTVWSRQVKPVLASGLDAALPVDAAGTLRVEV
jgi:exopolysaccharide biosynthesis polyprenyl glycosylphosphotransferase